VLELDPDERTANVIVNIGRSVGRATFCVGAASCIVPRSSQIFREKEETISSPGQHHAVQGIYTDDFPALSKLTKQKQT